MIRITSVETIDGKIVDHTTSSPLDQTIDGTGLTLLPALIDPHVHFRVPGLDHKEDWLTGARAAIAGGVTTVFDMPNTNPATTTLKLLEEKRSMINDQLTTIKIPLRYELYLGAHQDYLEEITLARGQYIGIKVFMGQSMGTLLMDNDAALDEVFRIAAQIDAMVAVHAEDEGVIHENIKTLKHENTRDASIHSKIRDRRCVIVALAKALAKSKKYGTKIYILHASTKEEVSMVRQAKQAGVNVYFEVTPHHLFLTEADYDRWGTFVQMNPPLRTNADQEALWSALQDGTIDAIGTDHAPHTSAEKQKPYGEAPSGVPGIETMLPLLLNAYSENKLTLADIVRLTHANPEKIFHLEPNDDVVLVDLSKIKEVRDENLQTKCGWSPFSGKKLRGWPIYTILKGQVYKINGLV